jgi:hypothetical protein
MMKDGITFDHTAICQQATNRNRHYSAPRPLGLRVVEIDLASLYAGKTKLMSQNDKLIMVRGRALILAYSQRQILSTPLEPSRTRDRICLCDGSS